MGNYICNLVMNQHHRFFVKFINIIRKIQTMPVKVLQNPSNTQLYMASVNIQELKEEDKACNYNVLK